MNTSVIAMLLFLLVPLIPVVLIPLVHSRERAVAIAPWTPLAALVLLPFTGTVVEYPWLLLGTHVGLDGIAAPLLVLAVVAWTAAGLHARRTIKRAEQPRFLVFWLASWCGNLCVLLTLDAASFYAAYAMMTFAAWGLIVHQRRPADVHAGRVYLVLALIGEALIIAGLFILASGAGNFSLEYGAAIAAHVPNGAFAVWLLLAGFAVKMGTVPLHVWLPLAHPQAPVPASAVLSGVMLVAGFIGWLRFLPLGEPGFANAGNVLLAAGLVSAFYGVLAGLVVRGGAKVTLAWSSISQMGLVSVIVGLALRDPAAAAVLIPIAVLFALHHGLAKTALFLGVDWARTYPRAARWLLWLPAASLAGLPLTSGALAKTIWKDALPADTAAWLEPLLYTSSIATTLLMLRFLSQVWPAGSTRDGVGGIATWSALVAAGLLIPWGVATLESAGWPVLVLLPGALFATAWPPLVGALLYLPLHRLLRRRDAAADQTLPFTGLVEGTLSWLRAAPEGGSAGGRKLVVALRRTADSVSRVLDRLEPGFAITGRAMSLWLLLLAGLFVGALFGQLL